MGCAPVDEAKLKKIFNLKFHIENIFFKAYEDSLDLPVKLNHTHFKTMIILHFEGERPMSDISSKLSLEKGSFTPVANLLIKLGYIGKRQSQTDRRVYNIFLTEKGETFASKFIETHYKYMESKLSELSGEDQDAVSSAVDTLNTLLEKLV